MSDTLTNTEWMESGITSDFTNDKMNYAGKFGLNWLSEEKGFSVYKSEFNAYHIFCQ